MVDVGDVLAGNAEAFAAMVREFDPMVRRLVSAYVRPDSVGDVAQETWIAVIRGLPRFEGRSSLRTWVASIALNRARTIGKREARLVPAGADPLESSAGASSGSPGGFSRDRFTRPRFSRRPHGHWTDPPTDWTDAVDSRLLAAELAPEVSTLVAALPERQRLVLELRDVQGLSSEEAAEALGISVGNARVLLHRARSTVRAGIEASRRGQGLGLGAGVSE